MISGSTDWFRRGDGIGQHSILSFETWKVSNEKCRWHLHPFYSRVSVFAKCSLMLSSTCAVAPREFLNSSEKKKLQAVPNTSPQCAGQYPWVNFFEKNIQINCSSSCHAVTPTTTSLLALTQHPIVIHLKMEERIIGSKRQKVCAANPEWNIRQTINLREKHENDHNIVFDRMKEPRVEIIILVVS